MDVSASDEFDGVGYSKAGESCLEKSSCENSLASTYAVILLECLDFVVPVGWPVEVAR